MLLKVMIVHKYILAKFGEIQKYESRKIPFHVAGSVIIIFLFPGEISPFFDKEIEKVLESFVVVM